METTAFNMERGIARCRVVLSLVAILALYVDPTEPILGRHLPMTGGAFTINRYWATVLIGHLVFSLSILIWQHLQVAHSERLATVSTCGDVFFAGAIALVTEGTTSPFYSFFAFAVLAAGLRSGLQAALLVTALSVALYMVLLVVATPPEESFYLIMRAAYIAITGYLVGYLGRERLNQEARIRELEAEAQREHIARSLHDGYAQALAGVNLRLETCRELFRRGQHDDVLEELTDLQTGVNREQDALRAYIRSLVDLEATRHVPEPKGETQVSMRTDFQGSVTLVEHVLLIMLEGMRNVRRHARARSASISAARTDDTLVLTIDDDGIGFPDGEEPPWSMRSRVIECGGELTLGGDGRPGSHVLIKIPEA